MNLKTTENSGRYYDADKYTEQQALDLRWWIIYFNGPGADYLPPGKYEAEEDVMARDKREASLVMRAALARDFDPGCKIKRIALA